MWLLESDGNVLEGKRIWLRPGKTYLFGRTHSRSDGAGKGFKIEHSTISRKHATITVELPRRGDVSSLTARSGLKIEDLNSKHGVLVGDRKLSKESLSLLGDEHSFRLGGFEETFSIKWHSVVFSFKAPSRDKDKKLLQEKRALLEHLDIKVLDKFDINETTHVVSNKRNTPQTLQALVHAKYIVDESILKELEYVTTEGNLDEPESMSKLELDFDAGWPDPLKFLPAVTREPNPKSEDYFVPDTTRNKVFNGYTFVMFDKKQYDGIQPAIVGGGGRATLHELKLGQSTAADIIRIMKKEFNDAEALVEGSGYGVLHVRLVVADPAFEEWATRIQTESLTATGQGLVEQNEFLEAILIKDARGMIKNAASQAESIQSSHVPMPNATRTVATTHAIPAREQRTSQTRARAQTSEQSASSNDPVQSVEPAVANGSGPTGEDAVEHVEQPPTAPTGRSRRNRTRAPVSSAFRGFVDDPMEPEPSFEEQPAVQAEPTQARTPEVDNLSIDMDDSIMMDEDIATLQTPRKRPLPPDLESAEDMNAKLYPAQAAAKRRRLEAGESSEVSNTPTPKKSPAEKEKKASKVNAEANYEAKMRNIREKQEEIKDEELEPMHRQLENMSFAEKQKLAKIAEFEVKTRRRDNTDPQAQDSRWKEEWNGRKNFKGFKKRGQPVSARTGPRIIIALEPIRVESATEQYLANKQTEADRRRVRRQEEQEEESELSQDYTDANTHLEEAPAELLGDGGPEIVDIDAPRATRASERASQAPSRARTTAASLKRQASTTTTATGQAKKHRKLNLRVGNEDASSEEDEIPKFRFKKK